MIVMLSSFQEGSTKFIFLLSTNSQKSSNVLPFWQFPWSEETVPSGHTHATVRVGIVSFTIHLWFPVQGLLTLHGF